MDLPGQAAQLEIPKLLDSVDQPVTNRRLRFRKQNPQIPQIIARRTNYDGIFEPRKIRVRIAAPKIVRGIHPYSFSARQCLAIGNRARTGTVSVNPICSRA